LEQAREAYRDLSQRNAIAAACQGLHVGDSCPVCGGTITALPDVDTTALDALKADGERLKTDVGALDKAARDADKARDAAERDLNEARKDITRVEAELTKRREALEAASTTVAEAFGGAIPADATDTLTMRIQALEGLTAKERSTATDAQSAELASRDAATALAKADAEAGAERARLQAQPLSSLAKRVGEISSIVVDVVELPDDAQALAASSRQAGVALVAAASALETKADEHGQGEPALLREATELVGTLVPAASSIAGLLESLVAATRKATADGATARQQVETLTERLRKRAEMQKEVIVLHDRAAQFRHLATELRADRLIAYLQGEALALLCEAGTAHLGRISDGRYRLLYEDDEFLVCDTWNGEEKRSVRTLSGGETFLASLALALALSEQVQALAVTQRARLDSLFLDEGFGSLDPGSLQIVEDALSQLGADGRMVGVITHIAELAERLPARILVTKSQRGSTLSLTV
jgi:DNA repair protein SbcC/Rad50